VERAVPKIIGILKAASRRQGDRRKKKEKKRAERMNRGWRKVLMEKMGRVCELTVCLM
jgi:hypothetical protein